MTRTITKGATDQSVTVRILSTAGIPQTDVEAATPGLAFYFRRQGAARVSVGTISDLAAASDAHDDGGLFHLGDGFYRLDVPDAAFAVGSDDVLVEGTATNLVVIGALHPLAIEAPTPGDHAQALLDAAVETNVDVLTLLRTVGAVLAGKYVPGLTSSFYAIGNPATLRVTSDTPRTGGRQTVTLH